jgi:hypothetical protein
MSDSNDLTKEEEETTLKKIQGNIIQFSSILEKFGLDVITKMGKNTLRLNILTDQINELHKSVIDIKGLLPQLNTVIENQKYVESELDLIKHLVQRTSSTGSQIIVESESVGRDESITEQKDSFTTAFLILKDKLEQTEDAKDIRDTLEIIKEDIFETTGGHRILYELAQMIKVLNAVDTVTPAIKEELEDKIAFWMNKL